MKKNLISLLAIPLIIFSLTKEISQKEKSFVGNITGKFTAGKNYYEFENNEIIRYIPKFEKFQEIKKDNQKKIPFNVCMHKSFAYYSFIQKDSAQLIKGYSMNLPVAHARVIINKFGKTFLYDPTWPTFKDGFPQEKDSLWKLMARFKKGINEKDYVYRKKGVLEVVIPSNLQSYLESYDSARVFPKAPSKDSLVNSIKHYSQKFHNN